ncbi:hypothetical protein PR048_007430 [Dryococelus australis]|uniref:Uncharacterized protein n=1 Tax=Dryococelus australis TaxID=614101 RepID=A0ABQ9HV46_9NEOP|nr:hypothetical protein PR048_007430 [Dryococelus australis]
MIDDKEIQNHDISLVKHFYIGTNIKLDPGSELGFIRSRIGEDVGATGVACLRADQVRCRAVPRTGLGQTRPAIKIMTKEEGATVAQSAIRRDIEITNYLQLIRTQYYENTAEPSPACSGDGALIARANARLPGAFSAFEAERRGSVKGDTATRIKCAIASNRKALNWCAMFSSCWVYLWDFQRRPYYFIGGKATVAERLARSPPTKANWAQSPVGPPDFRKWESYRTMPHLLSRPRCRQAGLLMSRGANGHRKCSRTPANKETDVLPTTRNRIRLERAFQKQSSDTYKTPYDLVKRCRERKINIKASERVNVDYSIKTWSQLRRNEMAWRVFPRVLRDRVLQIDKRSGWLIVCSRLQLPFWRSYRFTRAQPSGKALRLGFTSYTRKQR